MRLRDGNLDDEWFSRVAFTMLCSGQEAPSQPLDALPPLEPPKLTIIR